jgi:host factor-I protein
MTDIEATPTSEQDQFLDTLIAEHTLVSVYMINGIRLSGTLARYDRHVVMLDSPSGVQVVYKHAISTVMPNTTGAVPERRPSAYPRRAP